MDKWFVFLFTSIMPCYHIVPSIGEFSKIVRSFVRLFQTYLKAFFYISFVTQNLVQRAVKISRCLFEQLIRDNVTNISLVHILVRNRNVIFLEI